MGTVSPINKFSQFLSERGLTPQEADAYDIFDIDNKGACIAYADLDGNRLSYAVGKTFYRQRLYDPPPQGLGKYVQPRGSGTAAYLPRTGIDWKHISIDPEEPVLITEGEFKALEACRKWKANCIGLGGVNSWSPGKGNGSAILCKPLDSFLWVGRSVVIAFDYDGIEGGGYKRSVEAAARGLATRLSSLKCKVEFVYLGKTSLAREGSKLGLDDYIRAGGTSEELMATREEYVGDPSLNMLLSAFAFYAPTPNATIIDLADGTLQTAHSWQIRNRHLNTWIDNGGKVTVKRSTELWLDSPDRVTVLGYCFRPGEPTGLTEDRYYNIWSGFRVEPLSESEGGERKLQTWLRFCRGLFGGHWDWVQQWAAHMFQRPDEKCTITLTVMSSQEGIGKTLFGDFLARIIGGDHAKYIGVNQMFEKHTEWPRATLLAVVNELQSGYERHEDQLKDLVTADRCVINPKGLKEYTVEALFRLYFTTNRDYPFRMGADSRRYFVYRPPQLASDMEWKRFLKEEVGPLTEDEEALGAIHNYLLGVDLGSFKPKGDAPWTEDREAAAEASLSNNESVGALIWDALPEVFLLTPSIIKDPKYRQPLRYVIGRAASRSSRQMKIGGENVRVSVFAKSHILKTKLSGGKSELDMQYYDADEIRAVMEEVAVKIVPKYVVIG